MEHTVCTIHYAEYSIWNHFEDFFLDNQRDQRLKRNDFKKKNYIRPSAPSDCSSLRDQVLADDAASGGDDSSGVSLGGANCDDGGSSVRFSNSISDWQIILGPLVMVWGQWGQWRIRNWRGKWLFRCFRNIFKWWWRRGRRVRRRNKKYKCRRKRR